jgi:hypothetical protein
MAACLVPVGAGLDHQSGSPGLARDYLGEREQQGGAQ